VDRTTSATSATSLLIISRMNTRRSATDFMAGRNGRRRRSDRKVHKHTIKRICPRNDFCHIYIEEMNGLFLLSLLLTGDPQKAEQCFLSGFEDSVRNNYVFKEKAHSWARRSIMLQAIRLLCSRPGEATESNGSRLSPLIGNVAAEVQAHPDFARIVALNSFERFVFVMSILERYSAQECSLLLGCFRRDVINAQAAVVHHLASAVITTKTQPENDFVSLAGAK
jgi:hypothetical protein